VGETEGMGKEATAPATPPAAVARPKAAAAKADDKSSGARVSLPWVVGGLVVFVLVLATVVLWGTTPAPTDFQRRLNAYGAAHGVHPVALTAVSSYLTKAVTSTEDERFYAHHGLDSIGIVRALAYDFSHLSAAQGASTITEQLVKTLYFGGNDHSPVRKVQDAITAFKLSGAQSKEAVLAAYLNTTYFGHGSYGIGAASRRFFGTTPATLTLAQASLLTGSIQAPTAYDPFVHPAAARARQEQVLSSMIRTHAITRAEARAALAVRLPLRGGHALAAVAHPALTPPPTVVRTDVLLGALLILIGLVSFFAGRGWWQHLAGGAGFVLGLALLARGFPIA
jgi:membrane peptidoglycan carboxypeptidase